MKPIAFFITCLPSVSLAAFEPIDCGEEFFRAANSVYINPAALPTYSSISFDYTQPFGIVELQYSRISFNLYNFVVGLSSFGNTIYNEYELLIGYKYRVGRPNLGVDIRGRLISVKNYGSKFSLALDVGVRAHLRENIMLDGALQGSSKRVIVGFHFYPIANVHLMLYLYKELGHCAASRGSLELKIGELVQISPILSLIFGVNTIQSSFTLGTVFNVRKLKFGYLIRTHPNLGASHIVSLSYGF